MNPARQSITNSIQKGEYFDDAMSWYNTKYMPVHTQRLYIAILALIAIISLYVIMKVSLQSYMRQEYPFPIYVEDQVKEFSKISPLAEKVEHINLSVARYFVSRYVMLREEYDPTKLSKEKWEQMLKTVKAMSSRMVFSYFLNYIDADRNPKSPMVLYKLHTTRFITIDKIEFDTANHDKPDYAKVFFTALVKSPEGEEKSQWVGEVFFSMSDIYSILETDKNLQFTVTKYNSYRF
jgi:type IV secretory pathway component VirB8